MVDELGGEGVVGVHEAEVGLEARGRAGGGVGGLEHAGRVGCQGRLDGAGEGVEGGGVGGVEGDDEAAARGAHGGCGAGGGERGGDFGEHPDLAEGRDGHDHGFEGLGLRVGAG